MSKAKLVGLRERKKAKLRERLAETALELFSQRGYEKTTIDDVVSAVEVSRSTFFRYFRSKEDVAVAWIGKLFEGMGEVLASRPHDEKPFTSIRCVLTELVQAYELDQRHFMAFEELVAATPAIRAQKAAKLGESVDDMTEVLAKRLGMHAARDPLPRLMASTSIAIVTASIETWVARGGKESLPQLVNEGFRVFTVNQKRISTRRG